MATAATHKTQSCSHCHNRVMPALRFYRRMPDAFVCPECGGVLHRFTNEARRHDRLFVSALFLASFLTLLGLMLH